MNIEKRYVYDIKTKQMIDVSSLYENEVAINGILISLSKTAIIAILPRKKKVKKK